MAIQDLNIKFAKCKSIQNIWKLLSVAIPDIKKFKKYPIQQLNSYKSFILFNNQFSQGYTKSEILPL